MIRLMCEKMVNKENCIKPAKFIKVFAHVVKVISVKLLQI